MGVVFVLRMLRVTEFSKVRKLSVGKFIRKVSSVNGWKVWLFVEVTSTSDILLSDYFVREK